MSKRTDTIKHLFAAPPLSTMSADNTLPAAPTRVTSGAVRSLKDSFSDVEKENQELRDKIAAGVVIVEIDPTLIDPSPISDRFRNDDTESYEALKQSIAENGQEVPVLIREHPSKPGRYQCAYGHRRIQAARELGFPVKVILKSLSDEALVVSQGLENAPREDLSFIERAVFAAHIENAGHKRSVVQSALAIDRAEASKLIAVAMAIPHEIIDAIGKAPKIGRGRWLAFSALLDDPATLKRTRSAIDAAGFAERSSSDRFLAAFSAAAQPAEKRTSKKARPMPVLGTNGFAIAHAQRVEREITLSFDKKVPTTFADFLIKEIPRLFDVYSKSDERKKSAEA